jgi:hypothetical protein
MTEARAVVTRAGHGQPVILTIYAADHGREGAMALTPIAALQLAQDLLSEAMLRLEDR